MTDNELKIKLEKIENQLNDIRGLLIKQNKILNPPIWRKILKWCQSHIILIVLLVIVFYFLYEIYSVMDSISDKIETIENFFEEKINKFKIW
jgi:hypothetical protein